MASIDEGRTLRLRLKQVIVDPEVQPRINLDEEAVAAYAEQYRREQADGYAGYHMPRCVVFRDGDRHILASGFTRVAAMHKAGLKEAVFIVADGTKADAAVYAATANSKNGQRLDGSSMRRAIQRLVTNPEWKKKPDAEIASAVGCCRTMVLKVRKAMGLKKDAVEVMRDGKSVTQERTEQTQVPCHTSHGTSSTGPDTEDEDTQEFELPAEESRKPTKSKKQVLVDSVGRDVPDELRDVFADSFIHKLLEHAEDLRESVRLEWVQDGLAGKGAWYAKYLRTGEILKMVEQIDDLAVKVLEAVKAGWPYAVCPACDGKRCGECRNQGWMPRWRLNEYQQNAGEA